MHDMTDLKINLFFLSLISCVISCTFCDLHLLLLYLSKKFPLLPERGREISQRKKLRKKSQRAISIFWRETHVDPNGGGGGGGEEAMSCLSGMVSMPDFPTKNHQKSLEKQNIFVNQFLQARHKPLFFKWTGLFGWFYLVFRKWLVATNVSWSIGPKKSSPDAFLCLARALLYTRWSREFFHMEKIKTLSGPNFDSYVCHQWLCLNICKILYALLL